jgi:hypothetical protein
MEGSSTINSDEFWKDLIKQHWLAFTIFIIGSICAIAGAIWVLFWYIETSSIGAMGTATIGEWTLAWIWEFFIYLIFWELLLVGVPIVVAFGIGWLIFKKRLSSEEKEAYDNRDKQKHKKSSAGGAFGILMFIAFSIYMYIKGDFYTPFDTYGYSYWIYSWFEALGWLLIIFGIPVGIILLIVYVTIWRKK